MTANLATDQFDNAIQALSVGTNVDLAFNASGGAVVKSLVIPAGTRVVRLRASAAVRWNWAKFADGLPTASSTSIPLDANSAEYFRVPTNPSWATTTAIVAIGEAAAGVLSITYCEEP